MEMPFLSVRCDTEDEVHELLSRWEEEGILWNGGQKPTSLTFWYDDSPQYYNLFDRGPRGPRIMHNSFDTYGIGIPYLEYVLNSDGARDVEVPIDEYL